MGRKLVLAFFAFLSFGVATALRLSLGPDLKLNASRKAISEESLEAEQIHVTIGRQSHNTYVICWVTLGDLPDEHANSIVLFTQEDVDLSQVQNLSTWRASTSLPTPFTVRGCNQLRMLHSVEIQLAAETPHDRVHYQVGLAGGKHSPVHHFDPLSSPKDRPTVVSLFADFGVRWPNILDQLIDHTDRRLHDAVILVGDIAYDLDDDCNRVGDEFMNAIQPSASAVPWMFGPGNHEQDTQGWFKYTTFLQRFAGQQAAANASGSPSIRWFSYDVGLIHFAMIDTDAYVCIPVWPLAGKQAAWLRQDLEKVDRKKTPWVVVLGHRSMYCTDYHLIPECHVEAYAIRRGLPLYEREGIEHILMEHKVDLYLSGHTHHYQRSWPVYRGHPTQKDYINPQAPVHVVSGIAGPPGENRWWVGWEAWEAFRDDAVFPIEGFCASCLRRGFGQLTAFNATHLRYQQLAATDGQPYDEFYLVRQAQGSCKPPLADA